MTPNGQAKKVAGLSVAAALNHPGSPRRQWRNRANLLNGPPPELRSRVIAAPKNPWDNSMAFRVGNSLPRRPNTNKWAMRMTWRR